MARESFDIKLITRKIAKSRRLEAEMEKRATEKLDRAKRVMIKEFVDHPVSQEIAAGESATNISGTLTGSRGNLFTFIGFPAASKPIESIISLIQRKTFLVRRSGRRVKKTAIKSISRTYRINYLEEQDINSSDEARMPWESGSWISGIERGISSFSSYMYKAFKPGRSKKGVQAKKGGKAGGEEQKINEGTFSPVKYVSRVIENFKKNLRRI